MSDGGQHKGPKSNKPLSWGAGIVLVLVFVSFIGLPLFRNGNSGSSVVFGSYKGLSIAYNDAPSLFANQINNRAGSLGTNAPISEVRNAWLQAFYDTAQVYIVGDLMRKAGYAYTQKQVDKNLIKQVFTDENNNTNFDALKQTDARHLQYLEQTVESQLYMDKWNELQSLAVPNDSPRLLELLTVPPVPLRKFTVAYYQLSDYPLEEVEKYFIGHQQDFDQIELSRITVKGVDEPALQEKIAEEGSDFAQLATEYSTDFYRELGGKMGKKSILDLKDLLENDELVNQLATAQTGQIITHKQEDGSVVVFRVDASKISANWDDEDLQQRVRNHIETRELSLVTDYLRSQADLLKLKVESSEVQLGEQAKTNEINTFDTDYLSINYGGRYPLFKSLNQVVSNPTIANEMNKSELFFRTAFSLKDNEVSAPILLEGRTVVLLQLLGKREYLPEDGPFGQLASNAILVRYAASMTTSLIGAVERDTILRNKGLRNNFDAAFNRLYGRKPS